LQWRRAGQWGSALEFELFDLLLCGGDQGVILFHVLKEVRDVEEGIAVQTHVDERGLHAGEDPGDSALVDASGEAVFVFSLEIDLDDLIVLEDGHLGLVWRRGDYQLLGHVTNSSGHSVPGERRACFGRLSFALTTGRRCDPIERDLLGPWLSGQKSFQTRGSFNPPGGSPGASPGF
jgi:hypothetical protein